MPPKTKEKNKAVTLRKQGLSYSEIRKQVHVAQSSLSLWLKDIKLTNKQIKRIKEKEILSRKLGSRILKQTRMEKTDKIITKAKSEIGRLNITDLGLLGTALYWADGSKQRENDVSKEVVFSNSDPKMIKVFLKWLKQCLKVPKESTYFEIYIHKSHKKTIPELTNYWSLVTGFPPTYFKKVYFKTNKIHSIRKNRGPNYSGVLRISVRKSTDLNRKITGWIEGVCEMVGAMK